MGPIGSGGLGEHFDGPQEIPAVQGTLGLLGIRADPGPLFGGLGLQGFPMSARNYCICKDFLTHGQAAVLDELPGLLEFLVALTILTLAIDDGLSGGGLQLDDLLEIPA